VFDYSFVNMREQGIYRKTCTEKYKLTLLTNLHNCCLKKHLWQVKPCREMS